MTLQKVYFHVGREHSSLKETNGKCRVLLTGEAVSRDRGGIWCSLYMLFTFSVGLRLLLNIKSIFSKKERSVKETKQPNAMCILNRILLLKNTTI